MATIGIATTRNDPRNRKITSTTMTEASISVRITSFSASRM